MTGHGSKCRSDSHTEDRNKEEYPKQHAPERAIQGAYLGQIAQMTSLRLAFTLRPDHCRRIQDLSQLLLHEAQPPELIDLKDESGASWLPELGSSTNVLAAK